MAAITALTVISSPSASSATGGGDGCNPHRTNDENNYTVGLQRYYGVTATGVRAQIYNYSPYVYNELAQETTVWVMLGNFSTGRYAQIGWWEDWNGTRNTFTEYGQNGSIPTTNWYPPFPINAQKWYKMVFDPDVNGYYFYANSELYQFSTNLGIHPDGVENYSEIHTRASQMPGGSLNSETFYGAEGRIHGGVWGDFNGYVDEQYTFTDSIPSNGEIASYLVSWDTACVN